MSSDRNLVEHGQEPFAMTPKKLVRDPSISVAAKALWTLLQSYSGDGGVFPGQVKLSENLGFSEQHIRNLMKELRDAGWLSWERRGLGKTNLYTLNWISGVSKSARGPDRNSSFALTETPVAPQTASPVSTIEKEVIEKEIIDTAGTSESPKPKRKAPKAKPLAPLDEEAFTDWWKQYPRKASKSAARKAWHKIVEANQQEAVTVALENYIESLATYERLEHRPLDKSYQLHPSTFLNGAWEDWAEGVNLDRWSIAVDQLEDPNDQRLTNPHAFAPEWQPEDES